MKGWVGGGVGCGIISVGEARAAGITGERTAPGAAKERREILRSILASSEFVHAEEEGGLNSMEWRICQYSGRRTGGFLPRVGGAGAGRESRSVSQWLCVRDENNLGKGMKVLECRRRRDSKVGRVGFVGVLSRKRMCSTGLVVCHKEARQKMMESLPSGVGRSNAGGFFMRSLSLGGEEGGASPGISSGYSQMMPRVFADRSVKGVGCRFLDAHASLKSASIL